MYAGKDPLTGREIRFCKTCKTKVEAQIEFGKLLALAHAGRQPDPGVTVGGCSTSTPRSPGGTFPRRKPTDCDRRTDRSPEPAKSTPIEDVRLKRGDGLTHGPADRPIGLTGTAE